MQLNFELVTYNDELDKFELDETIYQLEIEGEDVEAYNRVKSSDLRLYNWLKESDFFLKYIAEEVYQDSENKKFAISDINGTNFRRFYFFKVTSGESHYEYFKRLFSIYEETEWQDREDVGDEILRHLSVKRQELIVELS